MSKLPSVDDVPRKLQAKPQELKPVLQDITDTGYAARGIDVRMNHAQAERFKFILRALEDKGVTLKDGTPVNNRRRAVLYMIETFNER